MSFWIELHCDYRLPSLEYGKGCDTTMGDGPGLLSSNAIDRCLVTRRNVIAQAQESGWRKVDGRWACTYCAQQLSRG